MSYQSNKSDHPAKPDADASVPRAKGGNGGSHVDQGSLPDLIGYQLRRAQFRVFGDFKLAVSGVNITPGQYGVMTLIGRNPGLTQSALSRAVGIERSTMVAVIDSLEGQNLVERRRSKRDARSYALVLTPHGVTKLAGLKVAVDEHESRIAGRLSAAERATLIRLLTKIQTSKK